MPAERRMWYLVAALVAAVLAIGAAVFLWVKEPPAKPWDCGTTRFVPGQSPYSIHRGTR